MTLLIHDANVLIDLINIDLLDIALGLPFSMATTDLVRYEIKVPEQARALRSCIERGKICLIISSAHDMNTIAVYAKELSPLSISDCSVLYHAKKLNGIVISGDRKLQKEAKAQKIEAHGTLWVLSQLVKIRGMSPAIAMDRLKLLMLMNPRLPNKECQELLEEWQLSLENKSAKRKNSR